MQITPLEIDINFNEEQSLNALSPMLVTLSGMKMLDRESQPGIYY